MDYVPIAVVVLANLISVKLLLRKVFRPNFRYRRARVGRFLAVISYFPLASTIVDLEAVRKTHLNINRWKDKELLEWKNSYVTGCSAIAVAVRFLSLSQLSPCLRIPGCYFCKRGLERAVFAEYGCDTLVGESLALC
jgi:hypothetical protein